jgi:hypothetical protein
LGLLEVQTLRDHLSACPFCAKILGGGGLVRGGLPRHGQRCCLCGQNWETVDALIADGDAWNVAVTIGSALVASVDDNQTFARLYQEIPSSMSFVKALKDFSARIQREEVRRAVEPRVSELIAHWESQFGCSVEDAEEETKSAGEDTHSRTLDPDEILSFYGNIAEWIRWLRNRGIEKKDLGGMRATVERGVKDDVKRQRIIQMFDEATAQWDRVPDK